MKQFQFSRFFLGLLAFVLVCFSGFEARGQFRDYGTANDEGFADILPLNGFYYMPGYTAVPGSATNNGTLTCVTPGTAATPLVWNWTREYASPIPGYRLSLGQAIESQSGNIMLLGVTWPNNSGLFNMSLVVMEVNKTTGVVLQAKVFTPPGGPRLLSTRIARVSDCGANCGGAYIVKSWIDGGGGDDILLAKLDYGLNVVWANRYDTGGDDEPNGNIVPTLNTSGNSDGGIIVAGGSSAGVGGWNAFLLEVDCAGAIIRQNTYYKTGDYTFFYNIMRAQNSTQLLTSGTVAPIGGTLEGMAQRIDISWPASLGAAPNWSRRYTIPGETIVFFSLAQLQNATSTGNVYAGYYTPNTGVGGAGFEPRLVKFAFATGSTNQRRELGGPQGGPSGGFPLVGFGTKILAGGGRIYPAMPPGFGNNDAWLGSLTTALNQCGSPTTVTTTPLPLTKGSITFTPSSLSFTTTAFCNNSDQLWEARDPCLGANYSNKTAPGTTGSTVAFVDPLNPVDVLNDHAGMAPVIYSSQPATERGNTETPEVFDFQIFPNPATETVEINLSGQLPEGETLLQVFDATGKLVKTQAIPDAFEPVTLDIGDLPKGIYSVKIGSAPAQRLTRM